MKTEQPFTNILKFLIFRRCHLPTASDAPGDQTMPNIQTILLFVFTSGQICGSQIFGGAGHGPQGHGHGVPPPRGIEKYFLVSSGSVTYTQ